MADFIMTPNRRTIIAGGTAAVGLAALPAVATTMKQVPRSKFRGVLDTIADKVLSFSPETATSLGVDVGPRAGLRARLSDQSPAGNAAFASATDAMMAQVHTVDRKTLSPADQLRWDTVHYALDRAKEAKPFFYASAAQGFFGGTSPYVVSQQNGQLTSTPEFLDSQHPINSASDAEAYLSRVAAFARALDDETAQIKDNADRGVMPPDFIAANVIGQIKGFRATPPAEQKLVTSIASRTAAKNIPGDWRARAQKMVESLVYPAVDRQLAGFTEATRKAPHDAGVQRLPGGDDYYRWALRLGTTTETSAAEIHALGLAQNAELKARIDALLKKQGMTKGSVGERVQALNKDPRQLYADNDAGRAQLIAFLNDKIAAVRPLMPKLSHLGLKADVTVKRVPADIQDGAALGYMNFASLDGKRPAIYYVNLKSTTLWPKYQLATLTAHEGIPGHTWQGAYLAEHHSEIPLISSLIGFNAFVEGWALYAEQLVDEAGLYANDPFSEIGYLQAQQFRACRLVADTGLHSMRWTREQTVKFLMEETGKGQGAMTSETDRYCASPGQACGYKMGHNEILRLRVQAMATLGPRFDLAGYNDALVKTGGVPLALLPTAVDAYVKLKSRSAGPKA
ncbi:DUF885 family protein [Sphingomonas sp.]|uniref:DUF885 domain-containing protein n=1 Tax=Sphingomonas sp. TaxID=28214 RepID=UPI0025F6FB0C|nr:DUF885 family protein [Sphingomonas sp.]